MHLEAKPEAETQPPHIRRAQRARYTTFSRKTIIPAKRIQVLPVIAIHTAEGVKIYTQVPPKTNNSRSTPSLDREPRGHREHHAPSRIFIVGRCLSTPARQPPTEPPRAPPTFACPPTACAFALPFDRTKTCPFPRELLRSTPVARTTEEIGETVHGGQEEHFTMLILVGCDDTHRTQKTKTFESFGLTAVT